jgi:hypothetical protein
LPLSLQERVNEQSDDAGNRLAVRHDRRIAARRIRSADDGEETYHGEYDRIEGDDRVGRGVMYED